MNEPLRAAAQELVDYLAMDAVIDGIHGIRVVSRSSDTVRALRAALDAKSAPPALDRERLARALLPGHLFEHPGGIETCDDRDPDAAREMAAAIADAYEAEP